MPGTISDVTAATHGYHHGDLPNALRKAATEVIAERGIDGFSLREVARRAGVSHTAPAHHFGDVRGLLTAVATEGFDRLAAAAQTAVDAATDPAERLAAIGAAYVDTARAYPAHFQVMFRTDIVDADDPDLSTSGLRAYGVLEGTLRQLIEAEQLDVDIDSATFMCWSLTQGLVQLEPKITLLSEIKGRPVAASDLIRQFVDVLIAGFRTR
jgi:AcrR family transcriptional regulator